MFGGISVIGRIVLPSFLLLCGQDAFAQPTPVEESETVEATEGLNDQVASEVKDSTTVDSNPETPQVQMVQSTEPEAELEKFVSTKEVEVYADEQGQHLLYQGEPYFIRGMNWGYVPIGTNYSYNFWAEPEWVIQTALDKEMRMLQQMGINSIRQYNGIPPEWVTYIYKNYGITTMINHTVGRYGMEIDGTWVPVTNYQDPRTRELLKAQVTVVIEKYKDVEGVLLWLLGNENNYGLH